MSKLQTEDDKLRHQITMQEKRIVTLKKQLSEVSLTKEVELLKALKFKLHATQTN